MASDEGGRWDVGAEDKAVYLARISGDDEKVFEDLIGPDDARELAGLLNKYADKAEKSDNAEKHDDTTDSDDSDDDEDSDDSDDSDDSEESEESEESEKSKD